MDCHADYRRGANEMELRRNGLASHPQVEIPARGGKLPGTYQGDADLAPSAERQRPRGPLVLPIFIREGWLKAMSHLP